MEKTITQIKKEILNYWHEGNKKIDLEKVEVKFSITKNQLIRLKAKSSLHKVALKIENFHDKDKVYITWVSYERQTNATNIEYKVLPDEKLNKFINQNAWDTKNFPNVTARLAKDTTGIDYIYLHLTRKISHKFFIEIGIPTGSAGTVL